MKKVIEKIFEIYQIQVYIVYAIDWYKSHKKKNILLTNKQIFRAQTIRRRSLNDPRFVRSRMLHKTIHFPILIFMSRHFAKPSETGD